MHYRFEPTTPYLEIIAATSFDGNTPV